MVALAPRHKTTAIISGQAAGAYCYTVPMELPCGQHLLRSWHFDDAESLAHHANNRKIWLNMRDNFPHPYTLADAHDWINRTSAAERGTNFAIVVTGKAVGGIGFELKSDVERYSAEVGYWLGEDYWGLGIATHALKAITAWALKTYHLNRLYALPFRDNRASRRVLEKAGYVGEGILRRSAFKNGQFLDQALYSYLIEK